MNRLGFRNIFPQLNRRNPFFYLCSLLCSIFLLPENLFHALVLYHGINCKSRVTTTIPTIRVVLSSLPLRRMVFSRRTLRSWDCVPSKSFSWLAAPTGQLTYQPGSPLEESSTNPSYCNEMELEWEWSWEQKTRKWSEERHHLRTRILGQILATIKTGHSWTHLDRGQALGSI